VIQRVQALNDAHPQAEPLILNDSLLAHWPSVAAQLPVTGMAQQLATQTACLRAQGDEIVLLVATEALAQGLHVERLKQVLQEKVGSPVKLTISYGQLQEGSSAQMVADEQARQRQLQAQETVANDSFVKTLISEFGGHILPGSVKAVAPTDRSVS
jgi:DNA polymerase-3 subunit gamma/tau